MYQIIVRPRAKKALARIPRDFQIRIAQSLRELADNPRPPRCRRLAFGHDIYRIRIGEYRVVYQVDDADRIVDVAKIARRDESTYADLANLF